jgi:transcriptional regulator with XRE-family HTH domain
MDNNDSVFGAKVEFFRTRKGWKQGVLAEKAGLSQSEVSRIENGHIRGLKEETIRKLAEALEVRPEVLARGTRFASLFGGSPIPPSGTADDGPPIIAYFASALTGLTDAQETEIKCLDEAVDDICRRYLAYPIALYRPRLNTSPKDNADLPARQVYEIDQERVTTADVVILAAIFPSLGAGMELQLALQSCCSVILIKKKAEKLSRMVLGCPASLELIEYSNLADLEVRVINALDKLAPTFAEFRFSHPETKSKDEFELGKRIAVLRDRRKLTADGLAKIIGVNTAYIEALESKSERIVNPSLRILRRIAKALFTSEAYLTSGQQSVGSAFLEHFDALNNFASDMKMPVGDLHELWNEHYSELKYELSMPGVENRADIGDRKYWTARYERLSKKKASGKKLFE